jgi:hypothetical protein
VEGGFRAANSKARYPVLFQVMFLSERLDWSINACTEAATARHREPAPAISAA